ncbi:MAG: sporulation integral membrane protein YtvI [Clostridiales bacterium]|jgi:sporulation integral membrane protein YtvI|nr:sporulation integral membrane protein YtvI [Eubacteriales bacterium]MDH7567541.1 sporulation integral membrane protein YtvI [Clostridiales bacterium]
MNSTFERYYTAAVKLILIAVLFFSLYILITYFLGFVSPFIIAAILAAISEPVVEFFESKAHLPRKMAVVVSLLLTVIAVSATICFCVLRVYQELISLQNNIAGYINRLSDQILSHLSRISDYYNSLPSHIYPAVKEGLKSLTPKLQEIIGFLVRYFIDTVKSVPRAAVFVVTTLLATYFISSDRRKIRNFIYKQLPQKWSKNFSGIKSNTFAAILGYFKAVLILMGLTFTEVSTGLFILGIDYPLIMGLIIAIADAVPILGTGLVMLPWILWHVIAGNVGTALGLGIVYLAGVILRQILEPKIIGNQIGLHPLVTLISMYMGLNMLGIPGMIFGPVSVIILKNLQQSGVIKLWKD